jgi:hypothetical protein
VWQEPICADEIQDKVWLPTEREMTGGKSYSNDTYETGTNQARLEYYTDNTRWFKYDSGGSSKWYYEASPGDADGATTNGSFCAVDSFGRASHTFPHPYPPIGVVPAFCVK